MGIAHTLHGGPVDETDIKRVRDVLLFEEPGLNVRLVRFFSLLVLASAIATYGLLADSVATVIGAMIVAPLMLPIMGLAFGISVGERKAILSSLAVGLGGIAVAVAVGWVLSLPFAHTLVAENNAQIMARTAPRLVDLLAALATGLAGAFALARKDVSDTLPGVAIAISLVPPLANAGILFANGRPELAFGSLLLFVTNYFAILLTGSLMFALMGYPKFMAEVRSASTTRFATAIVVVLALAITIPLAYESYTVTITTLAEARTSSAAKAWVAGSSYRVDSVSAGDEVDLVIAGTGAVPSEDKLVAALRGKLFGRSLHLRVVPETDKVLNTR